MTAQDLESSTLREIFCPGYKNWDAHSRLAHLEKMAHLLVRRLIKQELLADNQLFMLKAIAQEKENALTEVERNNRELERLNAELELVKRHLESEVSRRTRELKEQNTLLLERTRELEETNTALDVLLEKSAADRHQLIHSLSEHWRSEVIPELELLRARMKQHALQASIDKIMKAVQAGFSDGQSSCQWSTCLSGRESAVARLIAAGKCCREVALEMNISPRSVQSHCYNIRKKLNVKRNVRLKDYLRDQA